MHVGGGRILGHTKTLKRFQKIYYKYIIKRRHLPNVNCKYEELVGGALTSFNIQSAAFEIIKNIF